MPVQIYFINNFLPIPSRFVHYFRPPMKSSPGVSDNQEFNGKAEARRHGIIGQLSQAIAGSVRRNDGRR
jgi:hypothetical protein